MNVQALIGDIVRIVSDAAPLPDFNDCTATKAFAVKLLPDLIDAGYDIAGLQSAHAECCALPGDTIEAIVQSGVPLEKVGDGTILKWLAANMGTIISMILLFIPKSPAPA
jgi:hypothetical protein